MLIINKNPRGFYEVIVSGEVSSQEYKDQLSKFLKELEASQEKVNIVKIVENFEGLENWIDPVKTLKDTLSMWPKINKAALVTDMTWASKFVGLFDSVTNMQVKSFELEHRDEAYTWASK